MQLTELGNKQGPQRTLKVLDSIIESGKGTVLCSHRPALPTIFDRLVKLAPAQLAEKIEAGKALRPGEFMVLHLTRPRPGSETRIVAVETHYPPIED
jgi:8-oxo-dGTP diphosphatase